MKNINRIKRTVAAFIAAVTITTTTIPTFVYADEAELIKGTIELNDTKEYFYSDDYFRAPGSQPNEHLRTMSAAFDFTLDGTTTDYYNLLDNIGFTNIQAYDMYTTSKDTIGTVIAHKMIDGTPVIAVAVRGKGYAQEWNSNVIAGSEGDAQGFSVASKKVEERVKEYVAANGFDHVKYWLVGYSRAGAVANLVGRDINMDTETFKTSFDDIYTYTFEAPNSSVDGSCFENIHNVYDKNDFVTYLFPESWGFHSNGIKEEISTEDKTINKKVMNLINLNDGTTTASVAITQFIDLLTDNISRETYHTQIEQPAGDVLNIIFSMNKAKQERAIAFAKQIVNSATDDMFSVIPIIADILEDPYAEKNAENLYSFIDKCITNASTKVQNPFTEKETSMIMTAVKPMLRTLLPIIAKDFNNSLKTVLTFVCNLPSLFEIHYGDNIFDKLTTLDSFYS